MAINTKKPAMKQTVGAQYMCFANTTEGGEYDGTYEADVEKTEVVKSVKVTENSETSDVYASGKIYDSDRSGQVTSLSKIWPDNTNPI